MSSRNQNEKKYGAWIDLPNGGRRYERIVAGRHGWQSKYCKEVNAQEDTVRFWQEILDEEGRLREMHEKYPEDRGHRKV